MSLTFHDVSVLSCRLPQLWDHDGVIPWCFCLVVPSSSAMRSWWCVIPCCFFLFPPSSSAMRSWWCVIPCCFCLVVPSSSAMRSWWFVIPWCFCLVLLSSSAMRSWCSAGVRIQMSVPPLTSSTQFSWNAWVRRWAGFWYSQVPIVMKVAQRDEDVDRKPQWNMSLRLSRTGKLKQWKIRDWTRSVSVGRTSRSSGESDASGGRSGSSSISSTSKLLIASLVLHGGGRHGQVREWYVPAGEVRVGRRRRRWRPGHCSENTRTTGRSNHFGHGFWKWDGSGDGAPGRRGRRIRCQQIPAGRAALRQPLAFDWDPTLLSRDEHPNLTWGLPTHDKR